MSSLLFPYLQHRVKTFSAGQISQFLTNWRDITSDPYILNIVSGDIIEFDSVPTPQISCPPNSVSKQHITFLKQEITTMLAKNVITRTVHETSQFISPIFCVPKKDNKVRLILNLKKLNSFVVYHHFKMETIQSVMKMITPNCWMASIDLKDAYYSVKIHPDYQKYLKFKYEGVLYAYTAYPNGLASCPRQFTKLLKPPISKLRSQGHILSSYIDDIYIQSDSYEGCINTVLSTFKEFDNLGFVIHPHKSEFIPKQSIQYLGFLLDSVSMRISLPYDRKQKIKDFLQYIIFQSENVLIRDVAKAVGYMVSSLPAIPFGGIHYRQVENEKIQALKSHHGKFDANMRLSIYATTEITWWIENLDHSSGFLSLPPFQVTIFSDASPLGWGAVLGDVSTNGRWFPSELDLHINVREILAAYFAVKSFTSQVENKHIRLMVDNTTAVAVINHMGTNHSDDCNSAVIKLWTFCFEHGVWLTACHIPGKSNVIADKESRDFHRQDAEWMLNPTILRQSLLTLDFHPNTDLFASRLNTQYERYCSLRPDPGAMIIDAFTFPWHDINFYCFPPFSCILRILQKIQQENTEGVLVVPDWPTQAWYPILLKMLKVPPVRLRPVKNLLLLPSTPQVRHPLLHKLKLMVCLVSGSHIRNRDFPTRP